MKAERFHRTNLFVLMAITSFLLTVSCKNKETQEIKEKNYQTMEIKPSSKTVETNYVSIIRGKQSVEIRPQVSGTITDICIKDGATVRKGEVLFIIDQAPYLAALKTATANVKSAEAKLTNAQLTLDSKIALHKENIVSDFDLQIARNALLEAEATLEQAIAQQSNATTNLSYTEIKSPVNGVASMISYRVGALVSNNIEEPLITVSDDEEVHAYFSLTENQILDIIQQQDSLDNRINGKTEIKLQLSNGSIYDYTGQIDAISGTIDYNTGNISIRATFPNPDKLLRNGATGQVILTTKKSHCFVIPQSATYEIQNRIFVYKVVNSKATSVAIEVENINDGKEYIVTSGLKEGDIIICEGAGLVQEGAIVSNQ